MNHLTDAQLVEMRDGHPLEEPLRRHVAGCAACRERLLDSALLGAVLANPKGETQRWHPPPESLAAYHEGTLPARRREVLEGHLRSCAGCVEDLASIRRTVGQQIPAAAQAPSPALLERARRVFRAPQPAFHLGELLVRLFDSLRPLNFVNLAEADSLLAAEPRSLYVCAPRPLLPESMLRPCMTIPHMDEISVECAPQAMEPEVVAEPPEAVPPVIVEHAGLQLQFVIRRDIQGPLLLVTIVEKSDGGPCPGIALRLEAAGKPPEEVQTDDRGQAVLPLRSPARLLIRAGIALELDLKPDQE